MSVFDRNKQPETKVIGLAERGHWERDFTVECDLHKETDPLLILVTPKIAAIDMCRRYNGVAKWSFFPAGRTDDFP
jgi:hypothetical protein